MTWSEFIREEEQKAYYKDLMTFVDNEYKTKEIYPSKENIFNALKLTKLEDIKVVLIGQDPYSTPGYAMGLSFSVNDGVKIPMSLKNIYKEINAELGLSIPETGNLTNWTKKGILLINRILTVEKDKPLSHKNKGWETFTLNLIKQINKENRKIVFLLLGNEARSLSKYLDNPLHLVLETSHPSPLGARAGFIGSGIFKKTISYLDLDASFWEV